jgi:hypothetical protein
MIERFMKLIQSMRLKKGSIQVITSREQEGIYRGESNTLLRGIHVKPTYIVDKALKYII